MARIPEDVIQNLREQADIVEIVSREVALKRSGNSYKGRCPFHEEKTPSFHVYPDGAHYHCFGCGEHGSSIDFLMKRGGLTFRESLEELSRQTGIPLPDREATPEEAERERSLGAIREALAFAAQYFKKLLRDHPAGEEARAYLTDRGFTAETLEQFGVGFARDAFDGPLSLLDYALKKGFSAPVLEAAGLMRVNENGKRYDFFRGRVMFPIRDVRGRVIGFGARALAEGERGGPKYVNSRDTALFRKSRELYGQDLARGPAHQAGRLLVVEGYTDVMHCRQAGFAETVAGLGTALTADNAGNLRRFGVPVVLLYDGDEAGRRAAERAAELLLVEEVEASVAILPAGEDPADLLTREGPGALEAIVEGAQSLLDYRVGRLASKFDLGTVDGGERAAKEMLEVVVAMRSALRREMALKLLAERLRVPESILRNTYVEMEARAPRIPRRAPQEAREPQSQGIQGIPSDSTAESVSHRGADGFYSDRGGSEEGARVDRGGEPVPARVRSAEIRFLEATLADPCFWDRIAAAYPVPSFQDPDLRRIAGAVHTLRQGGESITRDALAGMLAESDETSRALQLLQPKEDAVARASQDLDELLRRTRLEEALKTRSLADVVRARTEEALRERTEADR
ncbi:MAG: DNA primase [Planctomycetota bacterium]